MKSSFITDMISLSLPMALALIEKECKSKKKSKEKDAILDQIRDTLLLYRPLKKSK